jgi:hypothetical protein
MLALIHTNIHANAGKHVYDFRAKLYNAAYRALGVFVPSLHVDRALHQRANAPHRLQSVDFCFFAGAMASQVDCGCSKHARGSTARAGTA